MTTPQGHNTAVVLGPIDTRGIALDVATCVVALAVVAVVAAD